jgi:hypothetical protein
MMQFLTNLFSIIVKAPSIIAVIKAIMDVIGSEQIQKILESIRDILKDKTVSVPPQDAPEPVKATLRQRIREKLGLALLGMPYEYFAAYQQIYNAKDGTEVENA